MGYHEDIRGFLRDELGREVGDVANSDSLLESGVLDSLAVMKLAAFIESRYGIAISEDDLMPEHFDTVDSIAGFIASKAGEPGA